MSKRPQLTITEAQNIIDGQQKTGLISDEEARTLSRLIRRKGDYGNRWSWQRQAEMRADLLGIES